MKKRLVSMLLALVMVLGMLPVTALAAGSEEEALGEVNIYNGEQKLSYLSINGRIRELIYTYFNHVDANGRTKEIPAYCVNPALAGDAAGEPVYYGAGIHYDSHRLWALFQNLYVCRAVPGGTGVLCRRGDFPFRQGIPQKLCGRVHGGCGDRSGLHHLFGLFLQRYAGGG